jgi:hypothetical protein
MERVTESFLRTFAEVFGYSRVEAESKLSFGIDQLETRNAELEIAG